MEPTNNDTDLPVPSLEALVASTAALMAAWAAPCADARCDHLAQCSLLARKIGSNLFFIKNHPCASPAFRQVMANAHQRWVGLLHATPEASAPAPDLCRHGSAQAGRGIRQQRQLPRGALLQGGRRRVDYRAGFDELQPNLRNPFGNNHYRYALAGGAFPGEPRSASLTARASTS